MDAFTKNGIYPTLIELNPIDGSKQALATIGYCAPCPDSDEHESGEVWKIRIPLPQFTSEAEFEGILKAHIAQMGALSKTLQTLGELLSALPGNKPVLDCFLSAYGYVQDVNGYVLSRPLKKCSLKASGTLISKKRAAQTRLRSDVEGHIGLFAVRLAHFGRTYAAAHA